MEGANRELQKMTLERRLKRLISKSHKLMKAATFADAIENGVTLSKATRLASIGNQKGRSLAAGLGLKIPNPYLNRHSRYEIVFAELEANSRSMVLFYGDPKATKLRLRAIIMHHRVLGAMRWDIRIMNSSQILIIRKRE